MTVAISQWEAFQIETLKAKGMSVSLLTKAVQNEEWDQLQKFDDTFDYQALIDSSKKNPHVIEEAIQSGYQVKFMTKKGIQRLIQLKFGLTAGTDYQVEEEQLVGIQLDQEQLEVVTTLLSPNWKVLSQKDEEAALYRVDIALVR